MSSARILATVAIAVLVGCAIAPGAAVAQEGNTTEDVDDVRTTETGPYDLQLLRSAGQRPSNAPPSVRAVGSSAQYWMMYAPTGFMRADEPGEREHVEPDTTVRRDSVYFRSSRPWDAEPTTRTLVTVYWEQGTVDRVEGNQTIREHAAVNQTVDRQQLELGPGYDIHEISLREHYDQAAHVTMFVEGMEQRVQWSYQHVSSAASRGVAISSVGDAAQWAFVWMFLPLALTVLGVLYGARKFIDRAYSGPGYRTSEYVGLAFFVGFFALLFFYRQMIDVVARWPWAVGILGGLGVGLIAIEMFDDDTVTDLFIRFDPRETETREDGSGIMAAEVEERQLVERPGQHPALIEDGLRPCLARAIGAVASLDMGVLERDTTIQNIGEHECRQVHLIDPNADQAVVHRETDWRLSVWEWPDVDVGAGLLDRLPSVEWFPVLVGVGVVWLAEAVSEMALGSGIWGFLVASALVLAWWAEPDVGEAAAELAPMHFGSVVATCLKMAEGLEKAADRDYYRRQYNQAKGRNVAQRKAVREDSEISKFDEIADAIGGDVDPLDEPDDVDGSAGVGVADDD